MCVHDVIQSYVVRYAREEYVVLRRCVRFVFVKVSACEVAIFVTVLLFVRPRLRMPGKMRGLNRSLKLSRIETSLLTLQYKQSLEPLKRYTLDMDGYSASHWENNTCIFISTIYDKISPQIQNSELHEQPFTKCSLVAETFDRQRVFLTLFI